MQYRVRFRPSLNGLLHLGGLYTAWCCWTLAKARGGEFILIADATVPKGHGNIPLSGSGEKRLMDGWLKDLDWLGCYPDETVRSDRPDLVAAHHAACKNLGVPMQDGSIAPTLNRYVWSGAESGPIASYQPYLTVGRVTDDHELGISAFHRGADLVTEAQLYDWMAWQLFGYSYRVQQQYGPVLCTPEGTKFSKSDGCPWTGEALRSAGYTPGDILTAFHNLQPIGTMAYGDSALRYAVPPL
jgi:glutamyl/glutaminyl-tRNA synthetase